MEKRNRWRKKERKEENGKGRREGGMQEEKGEGTSCLFYGSKKCSQTHDQP